MVLPERAELYSELRSCVKESVAVLESFVREAVEVKLVVEDTFVGVDHYVEQLFVELVNWWVDGHSST